MEAEWELPNEQEYHNSVLWVCDRQIARLSNGCYSMDVIDYLLVDYRTKKKIIKHGICFKLESQSGQQFVSQSVSCESGRSAGH